MKRVAMLGWCVSLLAGCADSSPPVERVPVAAPNNRDQRIEYDRPKPLPDNAYLWDRDREYQQVNPPANNPPANNQPPKSPEKTPDRSPDEHR